MSKREGKTEVVVHKEDGVSTQEFNDRSNAEQYAKYVSKYPEVKGVTVKDK